MGKGILIDNTTRQIIYNNSLSSSPLSPEALHTLLFGHKPSIMSIEYLKRRMAFMVDESIPVEDIFNYIDNINKKKSGRKKKFLVDADMNIENIIIRNPNMKTSNVREEYAILKGTSYHIPSISWINKCFGRLKYKLKVYTRLPRLGNVHLKNRFLITMRSYSDDFVWNLDETCCSAYKFKSKKGRGKIGSKLVIQEWRLGGNLYSAVGMYSNRGWLAWAVYKNHAITGSDIENFLVNKVQPNLDELGFCDGTMPIADNASIHHTDSTERCFRTVFKGQFKNVPPYSMELSPVEQGFANVWKRVRQNEKEAAKSDNKAMAVLNEAFEYYSYYGRGGPKAKNHFILYKRNHSLHHKPN